MDDFIMQNILNEDVEGLEPPSRRTGNPLTELPEKQFIKLFRVNKRLFNYIVSLVEPYMRPKRRSTDIAVNTRVLAALRFYAGGSYQADVGYNAYIGVSQQSVSQSVREVTEALNRPEILNTVIKFPRNFQELHTKRIQFYNDFGFAGVIGCIDCTHIAIVPPPKNNPLLPEKAFVNRKGFHSINCQLICDSRLKIMNVVASYPGSTHDSFIWRNLDFFLLGDSGYPLRSWLLTPVRPEPQENTSEYRFNIQHKRVRSLVERCNGLLKGRFRCCLKDRVLRYRPEVAGKIINACVVLHNLCIENNIPPPEDLEEINIRDELVAGRGNWVRVICVRFRNN
ncbi:hypothetical protein Zmor_006397 [Zophobas morio]|uniref:DDE Tnp4 domain-containing protein n=1 Tax=Zophobas morio TaxID=2755281 RepID=A0AA38MLE0_9CUCU|nr:hypothetical protein Zmor_006397 [Zophobas morio]